MSVGFANALKTKFPVHDFKILKFISTIFVRKRIKHINAVRAKERREKRETKKAAKKAKEEKKAAKVNKETESDEEESDEEEEDVPGSRHGTGYLPIFLLACIVVAFFFKNKLS